MRVIVISLFALAVLPRVEDPWPDTIGIDFPVTTAGVGGVLAGLAFVTATSKKRNLAIRWGTLIGFLAGSGLYLVSLLAQLVSSL